MKAKNLLFALCVLAPVGANAEILYRVEQVALPVQNANGADSRALARNKRFYIGASYDFSMWNNGNDGDVVVHGKNTSGFDASIGIRPYDIFRIEASYIRNNAEWNAFKLTSDTAMLNALFDARIDNIYRMFYKQRLVPYVGFGAGASWNSVDDVNIDNKISPVVAAMAGLGVELGEWFTIDFGYRYFYMFSPKFDVISDFAPAAHQFRAGVRINF